MNAKLYTPVSVYIHIPFCRHRCAYCDFNTYAGLKNLIPAYVEALCREIESIGEVNDRKLDCHTIFLGGGTPSLLEKDQLIAILNTTRKQFNLLPETEITMEANPGTLSLEYLEKIREEGINRLSIGMQSASPEDLRVLERSHDFFDVVNAVMWARKAGFDNINLDLMFGLPYQDLTSWKHTLDFAVNLKPDHLSVYSLILEHGTPMQHWVNRGLLPLPDEDLGADMYEMAMDYLENNLYWQYEISNWATKKFENILVCHHNMQYWLNRPYFGFGAGAHGFVAGIRTANIRAPTAYIKRVMGEKSSAFPASPAAVNVVSIDIKTEMMETMMVGLRLTKTGVSAKDFLNRFGLMMESVFQKEIDDLIAKDLVTWADPNKSGLILTKKGRLFGNQVFMQFV